MSRFTVQIFSLQGEDQLLHTLDFGDDWYSAFITLRDSDLPSDYFCDMQDNGVSLGEFALESITL